MKGFYFKTTVAEDTAEWVAHLSSMHEALDLIPCSHTNQDDPYNLGTRKVEAGGLEAQGYPWLYGTFKVLSQTAAKKKRSVPERPL